MITILDPWLRFTKVEGTIVNGDTGDVACDSYHRSDREYVKNHIFYASHRNFLAAVFYPKVVRLFSEIRESNDIPIEHLD